MKETILWDAVCLVRYIFVPICVPLISYNFKDTILYQQPVLFYQTFKLQSNYTKAFAYVNQLRITMRRGRDNFFVEFIYSASAGDNFVY